MNNKTLKTMLGLLILPLIAAGVITIAQPSKVSASNKPQVNLSRWDRDNWNHGHHRGWNRHGGWDNWRGRNNWGWDNDWRWNNNWRWDNDWDNWRW